MAELFDAFRRPVDFDLLREEQAAPTLGGVRSVHSRTNPSADLTPDRLTSLLRAAEQGSPWDYLELAEEMEEKDLHYLSVLNTRKDTVSQLPLEIIPASDDANDIKVAEFVRESLLEGELDLQAATYDVLDAIGKGFSVTEIIWTLEASRWTPRRLQWRDPRFFQFEYVGGEEVLVRSLGTDRRNQLLSLSERPPGYAHLDPRFIPPQADAEQRKFYPPATEPLAPFKFIVHFGKTKSGIPIRGGIARIAAWAYIFKNYILKDWIAFAETYGQPLRVGKYGPGATEADRRALLRAVSQIGTDAAAIVPESMLLEFVESKSTQQSAQLYQSFCIYLDSQVSKGVLGQTLTTELPDEGGSRAAAQVHDVVRHDIAAHDAGRLAATLNRDLVRPLVDLNLGPQRRYPQIKIGREQSEDLQAMAMALAPLIDRGLPVAQKTILDRFKLPMPAADEPVLQPIMRAVQPDFAPAGFNARRAPATAIAARGGDATAPVATATPAERRRSPDAIERFVEQLREESGEAMAPIIEPLLATMRDARDFGELKRRIVDAVAKMDHAAFVDLLARAGFNANLAGQVDVPPDDITPAPRARRTPRRG